MGKQQVEIITDDLDGSDITGQDIKPQTITFEGKKYEVYMSASNTQKFVDFLSGVAPLISKSSPKPGAKKSSTSPSTGSTVNTYGYPIDDVRAWAEAQGLKGKNGNPVTTGGGDKSKATRRINQEIYDAYHDAQK